MRTRFLARVGLSALLFGLLGLSPAFAQYESRGDAPGGFKFYVLSLSWSPTYCDGGGSASSSAQCERGRHRGFVVHGLWPQNERGYPSSCGTGNRSLPRYVMDQARDVFPDQKLAAHEWRKHGTCSGESPSGYFDLVKTARERVKIPAELVAPKHELTLSAQEIERAFINANQGLRADMIAVNCKRGGVLKEVRVCMTRDLRQFKTCEEVDRQACRSREITIPVAP